ncbi:MAG: hypothetical protein J5813_04615 [Candidatus Methanomethylophilaceae archaeon]|nr:hypothetical protein [Candidatus Methanomethylophilaceae archaeon]
MRGDLHTLKRVCSYASIVMMIGEIAFLVLAVASVAMSVLSFTSDDIRKMFTSLIKAGDSDLSLIAGTIEITILFLAMFITVKVIHDIMVSITKEHSPFMEENSNGFKLVSMTFLIISVPLAVLEFLNRDDIVLSIIILLGCILICVVMYCLTIIFRYGYLLQDESDHTL